MKIREGGAHALLLRRINELKTECFSEIVPIKLVNHRICSWFSIPKDECWELLHFLENQNLVEIIPFHGIKIKN